MSLPDRVGVAIGADRVPPSGSPVPAVRLWRRLVAEALGTGLLVLAVIGSGITAARLTPDDGGLQLAYHAAVVAAALAVLIAVLGPVSGAHFNPAVTVVDWLTSATRDRGFGPAAGYLAAQLAGAAGGAVLANLMFAEPAIALSGTARTGGGQWLGELVATAGLVVVIGGLARSGRQAAIPLAVGGWIGAAIWFTASASFANPAVTLARMLTATATGIAPGHVPMFILAQLSGAALGAGTLASLWPRRSTVEVL